MRPLIKRLWVTVPQFQLVCGVLVGPAGIGLVSLDWEQDAKLLEVVSEVAVIVSLYAAGVKMREPPSSKAWHAPIILASASMVLSVALIYLLGHFVFALAGPAALLLGAVLAPTDPVLADEVQVEHADDEHPLRQSLTGEAGFNDGAAFPFVLLAVGLTDASLHDLGIGLWRWVAIDLVWKILAALVLGWLFGNLLGRLTLWFRKYEYDEPSGIDELRSIGLIAVVYGVALLLHTYAFLAVFAAAVSLRQVEISAEHPHDQADDSEADDLLEEQSMVATTLERLVQVLLVVIVGILISSTPPDGWQPWVFAALAIFVIRPVAVLATLGNNIMGGRNRRLAAWFGVRGIGTVFYLAHAIQLGVAKSLGDQLSAVASFAAATITLSIIVHGSSMAYLSSRSQAV